MGTVTDLIKKGDFANAMSEASAVMNGNDDIQKALKDCQAKQKALADAVAAALAIADGR